MCPEVPKTAIEVPETAPDVSEPAIEVRETAIEEAQTATEVREEAIEEAKTAIEVRESATEEAKAATEVPETAIEVRESTTEVRESTTEVPQTATEVREEAIEEAKAATEVRQTASIEPKNAPDVASTTIGLPAMVRRQGQESEIGEKGRAKSSILRAIALAAAGSRLVNHIGGPAAHLLLTTKSKPKTLALVSKVWLERDSTMLHAKARYEDNVKTEKQDEDPLDYAGQKHTKPWFVAGYGISRALPEATSAQLPANRVDVTVALR